MSRAQRDLTNIKLTIARQGTYVYKVIGNVRLSAIIETEYESIKRKVGDAIHNYQPGMIALLHLSGDGTEVTKGSYITVNGKLWHVDAEPIPVIQDELTVMNSYIITRKETITSTLVDVIAAP